MGSIRERNLKEGGTRNQCEIRMKGHPIISATFDRKSDARTWIQKTETEISADAISSIPVQTDTLLKRQ